MHDYSIDKSPKVKVLFGLTFAAVIATPYINLGIAWALGTVGWQPSYSAITTSVSVFGLFSFFYWLSDAYLWKWRFARRLLLVPDLNGVWTCAGHQTMKNGTAADTSWAATVTIIQSWSRIQIHLKADQSESKSVVASICHEPGVGFRLLYAYSNNPGADAPQLHRHAGYVELMIDESGQTAEGSYFTDQHRLTVGTMKLRKTTYGK